MPKQKQYPLKNYIKAVEILAGRKHFNIEVSYSKGSAVRFDVFIVGENIPCDMWVVHTEHNKRKSIWSKEDYRKPDKHLNTRAGEFLEILEDM